MTRFRDGGIFLVFLTLVVFSGCATTGMSTMQKRTIETRELVADYKTAFRATMTVLQDNGYIIKNAQMDAGLITAEKDIEAGVGEQILESIFLGGDKAIKGRVYEVSLTLEEWSHETTRVRVSLQKVEYDASGRKRRAENVSDPAILKQLFEQIQVEIERRKVMK